MYKKEIEKIRKSMIESAFRYGFTSKEALQCSQKLDLLLNLCQKQKVKQ